MGCHDQGIRKAKDEIRDHVLGSRTFPKPVRDAVEALYPTHEVLDEILAADAVRFQNAMVAAGLTPTLKSNGVEMINALAKRYEDDVELSLAAAEFGQEQEAFVASLIGAGDESAVRLSRRLDQGLVPRDTFEPQFIDIVERVSDLVLVDLGSVIATVASPAAAKVNRPVKDRRNFHLSLISDKSTYRVDDLPVFTVSSEEACFLYLINVDSKGTATLIYPNKFRQDNFIRAGVDLQFPSDEEPFQFRLADPGTETVIAVCSLQDKLVDGINVDYSQVFTELGDYEEQIARKTRAIRVEKKEADDILTRTAIKLKVE